MAAQADNANFDDLLPDLEGLDEKDLRALIERAARIQEMTNHPGWGYFVDYLKALTVTAQRRILNGRCPNMEEYRHLVGLVEGLSQALDAPSKLADRVARIQRMIDADQADAERMDHV